MNLAEFLVGNNMGAHPDCLGIYIGLDEMYVAQTSKREGGVALESLIRVPIVGLDRSKLKPLELNESFFSQEYWRDALSKVTSKKSWNVTKVVVSLSHEFCLMRHFVISIPMKRQEWKEGIPNEARKYIHFPFDKSVYAYHVYEFETAATKQKRLGVVFTMTTKEIISQLTKGLKAVGLELVSVEPACLSLGRAFSDNDKEIVGTNGRIYSFFGKEKASFVFLNGLVPVLERDVDIAGSVPAERRRFEISNSAEFIAKQLERDPFEEAVIMGYNLEQWVPALEADSRKPVRKWYLSEAFGIETKSMGEVAAIGASGKFFDQKIPDIDFTKGNRLTGYEFNASWTVWKITFVLVGIMLAVLAKDYVRMVMVNYQLKQRQAAFSQTLDDFKGLSSSQLQTNLNNIKNQNETLTNVYVNSPLVTPILEAVANATPDKVWLNDISFQAPFPGRKGEGVLSIEGHIESGKDGSEDLLIGGRFEEAIKKVRELKRMCRTAKIRYDSIAGANKGKDSPASKDTKFVLRCSNERKGVR